MLSSKLEFKNGLPEKPEFNPIYRRAPKRATVLSEKDKKLAIKNALRYIPCEYHKEMVKEFKEELEEMGRIYGYRFRPKGDIKAKPIEKYKGNIIEAKAIQLMIDNNLDFDIALYPYELTTYGETGKVFQNWMQYRLAVNYLENMTDNMTLHIASGHPMGVFHSPKSAPRVIVTNGLMVGEFDNLDDFSRAEALGVANYGQMTAGGFMYIGPQGIVHGTYSTILNAGRIKLNLKNDENLAGILFVSSGLGGMSGAQGKAVKIAGGIGIIAEVDSSRIKTRKDQGWVDVVAYSPKEAFDIANENRKNKSATAIAFQGNIIELLDYAYKNNEKIELLSDQTSAHEVYTGGYCPVDLNFEERTKMLAEDSKKFKELVDKSLKKHFELVKKLVEKGTYFFDYGNAFMKAIFDSGIKEISKNKIDDKDGFIFPSYVEDILGPCLFDYGYGPFRWVCLSGKDEDLDKTDKAAMDCIDKHARYQDKDNYLWIRDAKKNGLVVGSKARILYQDALGRLKIAKKFNEMVRNGEIGPVMLGRDHHDTGGTDSPFRETSNIKDGSNIMADMASHVFAGNAARGMSLIALHNGGGTGIGKAINGGFGMVLDGSKRVDEILENAIVWDVMAGVARRNWARNEHSIETVEKYNEIMKGKDKITIPYLASDDLIDSLFD